MMKILDGSGKLVIRQTSRIPSDDRDPANYTSADRDAPRCSALEKSDFREVDSALITK